MKNPEIICDPIDHFSFRCACGAIPMRVKSVTTHKSDVGIEMTDKCTYIYAVCQRCGAGGNRKIYWENPRPNGADERQLPEEKL